LNYPDFSDISLITSRKYRKLPENVSVGLSSYSWSLGMADAGYLNQFLDGKFESIC
jgi:hypothetical protein